MHCTNALHFNDHNQLDLKLTNVVVQCLYRCEWRKYVKLWAFELLSMIRVRTCKVQCTALSHFLEFRLWKMCKCFKRPHCTLYILCTSTKLDHPAPCKEMVNWLYLTESFEILQNVEDLGRFGMLWSTNVEYFCQFQWILWIMGIINFQSYCTVHVNSPSMTEKCG